MFQASIFEVQETSETCQDYNVWSPIHGSTSSRFHSEANEVGTAFFHLARACSRTFKTRYYLDMKGRSPIMASLGSRI
eukprot:2295953-Amphidinium_carterae.1